MADFIPFLRRVTLGSTTRSRRFCSRLTARACRTSTRAGSCGTTAWSTRDNRRAVDFGVRERLLDEVNRMAAKSLYATLGDPLDEGRLKLFVTRQALRFRTQHSKLFMEGSYEPLETVGGMNGHLSAFARKLDDRVAIVVAPAVGISAAGPGRPVSSEGVARNRDSRATGQVSSARCSAGE